MNEFAIQREMQETVAVIRDFDPGKISALSPRAEKILLTGEGSSRIFPAKNVIAHALRHGYRHRIITEAALQAREYDLAGFHLYVASNSGKTAEGVTLIRDIRARKTPVSRITAVVAHDDTPIADEADDSYILSCGAEKAVAATKSVVEQALFYRALLAQANDESLPDLPRLAETFERALTGPLPPRIIDACARARRIHFAGRNDGVAEELTLKTNEITRKDSEYLEGTYAVHGIEEVMSSDDVVICVDPFPGQEAKFSDVLQRGVGVDLFAIAARTTAFPTVVIPEAGAWNSFLQLAAGWAILTRIGLELGIDLDTTERARKVGNEITD